MHPRTQELLGHLDGNFEHLRQTVRRVPVERRGTKPEPERWSVAEILEHLAIVEGQIERLLAKKIVEIRAAGLLEDARTISVLGRLDTARLLDRTRPITSPTTSQPTGQLDADAAWTSLERAHEALRETVRAADGLALGTVSFPHPVFGPLDLYQWIVFVGGHEARHAAQIAEMHDLPSASPPAAVAR